MKISSKVSVFLLILLSISLVHALKVAHKASSSMKESLSHMGETSVENSSCTKDYCMDKFGLLPDPFNPHCQQNATCWRQWYGFADCKDDNVTCWKQAVGYPKNCTDDDYDCWLKYYGYTQCEDVDCIKKVLNYTCKSDDLECWKKSSYGSKCKWNDWDCLANDTFIGFFCDQKKGIDCVKYYYGADCKQDDEDCWRKQLNMPDKECEKDVECYKKFYYLPTCKDDDLACWKGLYFGPDCKKGDMDCLKKFFYIPDCAKEKDEIQCYKKWLNYPDCKYDDGKCWKDYNKNPGYGGGLFMYYEMSILDHNKQSHDSMSFGKIMEHKRKSMAQSHAKARQFHRKRFETMH